jgi:LmbE family N-acetylglucosaminyl deacetylase
MMQWSPDLSLPVTIQANGQLKVHGHTKIVDAESYSWLLQVHYRSRGRWRLPGITTWQGNFELFTQYFPAGSTGWQALNLTGITSLDSLKATSKCCQLNDTASLLGFRHPDLTNGRILIVAPHPDDAELASYGLYARHNHNSWITTLTAGETLNRLERQYLPGLDENIQLGSLRKGRIRAWNSATTPLLAGLSAERLVMLGYFNDSLSALLADPERIIPSPAGPDITPRDFRIWNSYGLDSDSFSLNCGKHLLQDLTDLIGDIKPKTLIVTHPELDPHSDHIAAAKACAKAIRFSGHPPEKILLYANHLNGLRGFPYGPPHAAAGPIPVDRYPLPLSPFGFHSEYLTLERQKEKAIALDTMHDLRAKERLEKRLKCWIRRRISGIPSSAWSHYGAHDYFQTHIKAHENFYTLPGKRFAKLLAPD